MISIFEIKNIPLHVTLSRKTKKDRRIGLSLNVYRNLHQSLNHQSKVSFYAEMNKLVLDRSRLSGDVFKLEYLVFLSRRNADMVNFGAVVDKFVCDWLVESGILAKDTCEVIVETVFRFGGIDSKNPHADLMISGFEKKHALNGA